MTDTTQPEALHAGIADSHMGIERLQVQCESLRAQLAEARAEARRFQILIDTAPGCLCFMGQDYRTGDEFRAAIDAFLMEPSK